MKISYSSSTTYLGCKRKFWHKKVNKTTLDPDAEVNTQALSLGKAFHKVLEDCGHNRKKISSTLFHNACETEGVSAIRDKSLVWAMVRKYLDLHIKSGLTVKTCEIEIGDENVIGYIDAIMIGPDRTWWIVDLKTAGRLNDSLLSRLNFDPQLNLYAHYADKVAQALDLDLDKFMGVRYRVTTKSQLKGRKDEDMGSLSKRMYEAIESYDIPIHKSKLSPEKTFNSLMAIKEEIDNEVVDAPEQYIPQNFSYCEQYFKPCEYWSRCYGDTFTRCASKNSISSSQDMKPVDSVVEEDTEYDDDLGAL